MHVADLSYVTHMQISMGDVGVCYASYYLFEITNIPALHTFTSQIQVNLSQIKWI